MTDFLDQMHDQNDYLRRQIHALRKGDRRTWRRHRLLDVVCSVCGQSLAEVMDTKPYPMLLTSEMAETHEEVAWRESNPPPDDPRQYGQYALARGRAVPERVRRGEGMITPLCELPWSQDHEDQARDERYEACCNCRGGVLLPMQAVIQAVRRGERKVVVQR